MKRNRPEFNTFPVDFFVMPETAEWLLVKTKMPRQTPGHVINIDPGATPGIATMFELGAKIQQIFRITSEKRKYLAKNLQSWRTYQEKNDANQHKAGDVPIPRDGCLTCLDYIILVFCIVFVLDYRLLAGLR